MLDSLTWLAGDAEVRRAVGWTLSRFDDNSVVGHARRRAGMGQDIFIGGGALLVRCTAQVPFFPDVYNEDWLFLIQLAATSPDHRRALGWAGRVHQCPYDPFRSARARSEEAGEILGEGLMNLFQDDGPAFVTLARSSRYWVRVKQGRRRMIEQLRRRLAAGGGPPTLPERRTMARVLRESIAMHSLIKPDVLVDYVRVWQADHRAWHERLAAARSAGRPATPAPARAAVIPAPAAPAARRTFWRRTEPAVRKESAGR